MRPIEKWEVGKILAEGTKIQETYSKYQSAKRFLIDNLGSYCSYCENAYRHSRDLHVEHVLPKSNKLSAHLSTSWDNFLLSCPTCNGMDNKGTKYVDLETCHFPHRNNTFLSFRYLEGGVIIVNPDLSLLAQAHAKNLLELTGLDKGPKQSSPTDNRWKIRFENWVHANRYLKKYENGETQLDSIIDLVKAEGGWSIWFTVFKGKDEVREALIKEFPGTSAKCFDSKNHYEPVNRNPNKVDPT